jgi:hypothetical protein
MQDVTVAVRLCYALGCSHLFVMFLYEDEESNEEEDS